MSYDANAAIAALFIFYGVLIGVLVLTLVALYVVYGIALSMFFRKVGVEPWIGWVPYYRYWKWLEVGGQQGAFSLFSLIPYGAYATTVFLCIGMWRTGKAFGKDAGMLVLGIFLPFVWLFVLASRDEVYRPELITAAGFPPPRAGYGSAAYAAAHPDEPWGPRANQG
jgi:Family of unknown function (DUF5684)